MCCITGFMDRWKDGVPGCQAIFGSTTMLGPPKQRCLGEYK